MSQITKSVIIVRECQGCGKIREYDLMELLRTATAEEPTKDEEKTLLEATMWLSIIRESAAPDGQGGFQKMIVHACNPTCAVKAATRLFQMPTTEEEPVDSDIDLSKLKQS